MKLEDYHNLYSGKRAFIVATGPSLRISDLDLLKNEITLSCNKIFLAFSETEWRPTFYSIIDRLVAQELTHEVAQIDAVKIFSGVCKPYFDDSNILWLKDLPTPVVDGQRLSQFSKDVAYGTYGGYSVVYTLMQIAYYLGIRDLYLLGLDFNFKKSIDTGMRTDANEVILQQGNEQNHFHKDYRPSQSLWTEPRLDIMYDAFKCAHRAFQDNGRRILNASRFSALDVFPKVDFDTLF